MKKSQYSLLILFSLLPVISAVNINCRANSQVKNTVSIQDIFIPSGYMGDGQYGTRYIAFEGASTEKPRSGPDCIKIKYTFGPLKFAGIYWQNIPNNWGNNPGNDYSQNNFKKVTFWARGENGTEKVEFKSGGINADNTRYHDSYTASSGRISLTKDWRMFSINVANKNLSSVIGAFCWTASSNFNPGDSMTFYIDDIQFE